MKHTTVETRDSITSENLVDVRKRLKKIIPRKIYKEMEKRDEYTSKSPLQV